MALTRNGLSSRIRRLRIIAADKAFPGGLAAHGPAPVVALAPPPAVLRPEDLAHRSIDVIPYLTANGPLRQDLASEITEGEIDALLPRLSERERHFIDAHDPVARRTWALALAIHHGVSDVAARTGLSAVIPPEHVHAMYHESWSAGGDAVYSDMIDVALREAGHELAPGQTVLDFGTSSGRVVRMLAARRPDLRWAGCDVNEPAIDWAAAALPAIDFRVQPLRPPLPWPADAFDAAFAISIWSHFDQEPALAWLEEMRRVIRIGGALLLTAHGEGAIAARAADPDHGPDGQAAIARSLYRDGFAFVDIYGDQGDWGVVDSGWGASFVTPEWLLSKITPQWRVALYRPAAIDGHQDLYVLTRER